MRKGFTLVEIMIVVAIIALLAAIAIPNLLRARVSANEAAAAAAMHTIAAAQIQYRASNPTYASLGTLGNATPPYIDSRLAGGSKQGYNFTSGFSTGANFWAAGEPQDNTAAHTFYIDEDGVICRSSNTSVSAETSHFNGSGCPTGYAEVE
ncbi:MAG: prepilin-type N-terminal cleavage/methylation domain-containing protein [Candidatus Omnitrophica bacterium]|nr:prepilin-type N-terminal cleavage/methylation domain-containing protein [Candidatus Omnitrophota bacterium]